MAKPASKRRIAASPKRRRMKTTAPRQSDAAAHAPPRKRQIVKREGVCGGVARIFGTRLPVWFLVQTRQLGYDDQYLLEGYPFINAKQLAAAWRYAKRHPREIAKEIRRNMED